MRIIPFCLIVFGLVIIFSPEILAYLIGGFFIFLGLNGLIIGGLFSRFQKENKENYVKFGKYKIYR